MQKAKLIAGALLTVNGNVRHVTTVKMVNR